MLTLFVKRCLFAFFLLLFSSEWFNQPFQNAGCDDADLDEEENMLVINRLHQVLLLPIMCIQNNYYTIVHREFSFLT